MSKKKVDQRAMYSEQRSSTKNLAFLFRITLNINKRKNTMAGD